MLANSYPAKTNTVYKITDKYVLDDTISVKLEQGTFMTFSGFNSEGNPMARGGGTSADAKFIGIAMNGIFSDKKLVVKEGTVTVKEDGKAYVELSESIIAGTETLFVNGTKQTGTSYSIINSVLQINGFSAGEVITYKFIGKANLTTADAIENLYDTDLLKVDPAGTLNIAQEGIFMITNFNSSCDFSNATDPLMIDSFGTLVTKSSGYGLIDVSNHVRVLHLPEVGANYLMVELF